MIKAFLALGSNIEDPVTQVKSAIVELDAIPQIIVTKKSSLYFNPPIGILDQPNFVNAVIEIKTNFSCAALLKTALWIEEKHHRIRLEKNGPRTLDIDILLYGEERINQPSLQVPHPRLKERAFVIIPLAELVPDLILPCGISIQSLSAHFKTNDLVKLSHDGESSE